MRELNQFHSEEGGEEALRLEKIEIVEDQKHGQNEVDNHTSQNYNVEHF